jgi:DnaK suppressor protein
MARKPRPQQQTDAARTGSSGSGKLDAPGPAPPRGNQTPPRETSRPDLRRTRARLARERAEAVERLAALRQYPEFEAGTTARGNESTVEEGDAVQASAQRDVSFAARERLETRIGRLGAALERIERGEYGRCTHCGRDIETERLQAIPEAALCLECQAWRERTARDTAA